MRTRPLLIAAFALVELLLVGCSSETAKPTTSPSASPPRSSTPTSEVGCSVVTAGPTPGGSAVLPPIAATDYARGPTAASVTMLYYCDFQSTQCELFNRVLDDLVKNHPSELRVVFRPFPVPSSVVAALDKSELAARAALAASDQDRFWEMRDILHSRFSDWANLPAGSFERWTMQQAAGLGLDKVKFQSDMQSAATEARVRSMYDSAVGIGISSIPTVFINGRLQPRAALSYDGLEATISLIALGSRQFKTCPPFDIDPSRQYRAILHTEKGDIVIALYPDKAPLAVNSFVFLARHRWYDGVTFHRVIPGFLAQAGDPSGTGRGGPGYLFNSEVHADMLFDRPGVVGMANAGPDTNGSQFFITYGPEAQLDGSFTVFGQVIAGMNVVESLTPRDPQSSNTPPLGDKILTVMIEEQ